VLGPLLFSLYTADISRVVEFHGHKVHAHQYADDCQVYRSIPVSEAEAAVDDF